MCQRDRGVLSSVALVAGLALLPLAAAAGILDGAVAYWPFDSGATLGDDVTANNNDGLVLGGVSPATGSQGVGAGNTHVAGAGAALFDGTSGYIRVADSASLDSAAGTALDRTLAFWFKTTTNQNRVVFEKGANTHFVVQTESVTAPPGKISFRVDGNNAPRVISNNAVNDNLWHHFAATYSGGSNAMELYIDGLLQTTNTQASPAANNSPLVIGARDGGAFFYPGSMDDAAVWSRVLTKREIAAVYQGGLAGTSLANVVVPAEIPPTFAAYTWAVLKDAPRFYWSFNEGGGLDDALDHVRGQTSDRLSPSGNATRSASYTPSLSNAASLDGANSFFRANALGDGTMPGAWAVEMWLKAEGSGVAPPGSSGSRADYILNAGSGGGNNPAVIYDFGDDGVDNELELYAAAGRTDGGPRINDSNWHHVVLTYYGNGAGFGVADRVDVALDGVATPSIARGGFASNFDLNSQLLIGAALATGVNSFQGKIDEVALYDLSGLSVAGVEARVARLAAHFALAAQAPDTLLSFVKGATYQYAVPPAGGGGAYEDPALKKLTDGVIGSTVAAAWGTGQWAGWQVTDPVITFNVGTGWPLDSLLIHYLVGHSAGVYAPDTVLIQFSNDGLDFTSIPSILSSNFNDYDPGTGLAWNRMSVLDLGHIDARYVRLSFANDQEWTFLGEIQLLQVVPEPATLSLLALGLLALRRRCRAARRCA